MAGFIRRFSEFPPDEVITAIEGINIIDLPPPAAVQGLSTNVVALVGEFSDMTYAVVVDSAGVFTSNPQAQDIISAQDLLNKFGGFDPTLGQFGGDCGSGYAELRNKTFGRLVGVAVNLASASGVRLWRELPTNKSATDPTPIVPIAAADVAAGREFKSETAAVDRLKIAARTSFSNADAYKTAVDGSVTAIGAALTQIFTSATGSFLTLSRPDGKVGVEIGDILVIGVIGGAAGLGANALTYRVRSITDATNLVAEKISGTSFDWTTAVALPYRLHAGHAADSYGPGAGSIFTAQGSFTVPVRPLTDGAGTGSSGANGTWAVDTRIDPLVAPAAPTATTWDPLSGLDGKVGPTTAVAYTAGVQRANAINAAAIDVLYAESIDSLLFDNVPASEVAHVWAARKSSTIRTKLRSHVLVASENGVGRTCSISPELDLVKATALTSVGADADPGVGANRDERVFYDWPPSKTFIPEAVGIPTLLADGSTTSDGILDTGGDGWMASIMGSLAPERNPGEASGVTRKVLAPILGYATNVPNLDINAWKFLRLRGVAGVRIDKTVGPIFQSGVTTSLTGGKKNINRRKMADFIQDSIANALKPFAKLPMSESFKDGTLGQVDDFLQGLLSPDNVAAQRIDSYVIDGKSGNTPQSEAQGIYVIIIKVRTLATADFIVLQTEIGEGVVTSAEVSSS